MKQRMYLSARTAETMANDMQKGSSAHYHVRVTGDIMGAISKHHGRSTTGTM